MKFHSTVMLRFIIFFLVLLLVGSGVWIWWKDGMAPMDAADTTPVEFQIAKGEGVKSIAARLAQQNLIRSSTAFFVLVKLLKIDDNLQAGDFRLNKSMDAQEVAKQLTHGTSDIWVTTLEGWRSDEIATKFAKDLDIPEREFLKYAKEGYMFPDTYLVQQNASGAAVAQLLLDTFSRKVPSNYRDDAKKNGLTFEQTMVLASIVEREGRTEEDRPIIAGILLKRLKANWPLQADATLQYALGYQAMDKTWWKKELTDADKQVNSPYNTYKNPGLPPTPICNPGTASIRAAVYPKETEYWYYLHDGKGVAHYAKTIEEHNANISKYL